jgi:hypothetical protein
MYFSDCSPVTGTVAAFQFMGLCAPLANLKEAYRVSVPAGEGVMSPFNTKQCRLLAQSRYRKALNYRCLS